MPRSIPNWNAPINCSMGKLSVCERIWLMVNPMFAFVPSVNGPGETKLQKKIRTQAGWTNYRYGHPLHSADSRVDSRLCRCGDFSCLTAGFPNGFVNLDY